MDPWELVKYSIIAMVIGVSIIDILVIMSKRGKSEGDDEYGE